METVETLAREISTIKNNVNDIKIALLGNDFNKEGFVHKVADLTAKYLIIQQRVNDIDEKHARALQAIDEKHEKRFQRQKWYLMGTGVGIGIGGFMGLKQLFELLSKLAE